ncbi:hypothetical protein B0T21DRAFT_371814 [Apiosordaria backusii]|uniref:Uncharacterized protein n=1 Tax=Apiosordaria backusii TaxID=314023 RepID=A0AA40B2N7_9PEZI|nr:hypothetical protein B0T21DRAFT_371814 [Apiosordaria backusii]
MSRLIRPDQLRATEEEWRVMFPGTDCSCGWYHFYYAGCGHLHRRYKSCCGGECSSHTGQPIFCQRPAPSTNVYIVRIEGVCDTCHRV